jgi:GMP synthase-like glutamine amidotransferase
MNLGILNCDQLSRILAKHYGSYAHMFERLFHYVDPQMIFTFFNALQGELPKNINDADAYIITGSRYGVNDGDVWIEQLEEFIRSLYAAGKKVIGICFGHQLIAKALGGKVTRSPTGWGVGVLKNHVLHHKHWMQPEKNHFNLLASHQDQVIILPPKAELLASSDFCINYMMQIDNMLGIQGHPEFTKDYAKDLMILREDVIEKKVIEEGIHSLKELDHENILIARWMTHFLYEVNS